MTTPPEEIISSKTVEQVGNLGDTETTPEPEGLEATRSQLLHALTSGREAHETRILSSTGIAEIARELGVNFTDQSLEPGNVAGLLRMLKEKFPQEYLFPMAFELVARGQVELDRGELPNFILNEVDEPIGAYLGGLEFVDIWLDRHTKKSQEPMAEAMGRFQKARRTADWQRAIDAADAVETGTISRLKDITTGEQIELGKEADTVLGLHDDQGRDIGPFTTFMLANTTLGEDTELQNRLIPGSPTVDFKALITGKPSSTEKSTSTFMEEVLPANEYPDRAVAASATVQHVMGVIPLPPGRDEVKFEIVTQGPDKKPFQIEIITGENWHTRNHPLYKTKPGRLCTGLPSVGSEEQFFVAQKGESMGARRAAKAEEVGRAASTSVVLVLKPTVPAAKAEVFKAVILFKQGKGSISNILDKIECTDSCSVFELQSAGYITEEEAKQLTDGLWERSTASLSSGSSSGMGSSDFRGLGLGERLHTGASGTSTGRQYGIMRDSVAPDPFAPPKIIVIEPFGISGTCDTAQETRNLTQIVVDLNARRKAKQQ